MANEMFLIAPKLYAGQQIAIAWNAVANAAAYELVAYADGQATGQSAYSGPGLELPAGDQGLRWAEINAFKKTWADLAQQELAWSDLGYLVGRGMLWSEMDNRDYSWDTLETLGALGKGYSWDEFEALAPRGLSWARLDAARFDWARLEGQELDWGAFCNRAGDIENHVGCLYTVPDDVDTIGLVVRARDSGQAVVAELDAGRFDVVYAEELGLGAEKGGRYVVQTNMEKSRSPADTRLSLWFASAALSPLATFAYPYNDSVSVGCAGKNSIEYAGTEEPEGSALTSEALAAFDFSGEQNTNSRLRLEWIQPTQ